MTCGCAGKAVLEAPGLWLLEHNSSMQSLGVILACGPYAIGFNVTRARRSRT